MFTTVRSIVFKEKLDHILQTWLPTSVSVGGGLREGKHRLRRYLKMYNCIMCGGKNVSNHLELGISLKFIIGN